MTRYHFRPGVYVGSVNAQKNRHPARLRDFKLETEQGLEQAIKALIACKEAELRRDKLKKRLNTASTANCPSIAEEIGKADRASNELPNFWTGLMTRAKDSPQAAVQLSAALKEAKLEEMHKELVTELASEGTARLYMAGLAKVPEYWFKMPFVSDDLDALCKLQNSTQLLIGMAHVYLDENRVPMLRRIMEALARENKFQDLMDICSSITDRKIDIYEKPEASLFLAILSARKILAEAGKGDEAYLVGEQWIDRTKLGENQSLHAASLEKEFARMVSSGDFDYYDGGKTARNIIDVLTMREEYATLLRIGKILADANHNSSGRLHMLVVKRHHI